MSDPVFSYVNSPEQLQDLVDQIRLSPRIAIDTEADSLHHYYEKVCLIQISLGNSHFIVDPLADMDLSPLLKELSSKSLMMHGADYDLRMLRLSFGFEMQGELFDTMLAAQILGYKELGLAALVSRYFGIELPKHGQKADWSKRPLPEKLVEYAYGDTRYLDALADILESELKRLSRQEWHRETCKQVIKVAATDNNRRDPGTEWRIKGSSHLPPHCLLVLKSVWQWRDAEAQKADIPPFKILSNQGLLDLVAWVEKNPKTNVDRWPGLPKRYYGRRLAHLKAALNRAREWSFDDIRGPERESRYPQNIREEKNLVEALRMKRDAIASQLSLDPAILAPRAMLSAISRIKPQSLDDLRQVDRMLSWQISVLGQIFVDAIREYEIQALDNQ